MPVMDMLRVLAKKKMHHLYKFYWHGYWQKNLGPYQFQESGIKIRVQDWMKVCFQSLNN